MLLVLGEETGDLLASRVSASPGSLPAGTSSPKRLREKDRTRLTKLPRVSARSLFTVAVKCSQVKDESSDSGALAMRK